ncbi:MAG: hypothetical protein IKD23_03995 [Lentisphaeria bacterium]|nr:hypothetical protein [Lentisphaeria bacterium]
MKKIIVSTIFAAVLANSAAALEIIRPQLVCGGEAQYFRKEAGCPDDFNRKPIEATAVTADCDRDNLYLTFDMEDDDTFNSAKLDQDNLRRFGDTLQIFLKSEKETYLWEFMVSCNGKKSCFFHMGAGRMFYPEAGSAFPEFSVENRLTAGRWLAKVTIPLSIFREKGFKFTNDEKWTFMLIRTNDSRFHSSRSSSCFPQSGSRTTNPAYFGELVLK